MSNSTKPSHGEIDVPKLTNELFQSCKCLNANNLGLFDHIYKRTGFNHSGLFRSFDHIPKSPVFSLYSHRNITRPNKKAKWTIGTQVATKPLPLLPSFPFRLINLKATVWKIVVVTFLLIL